MECFLYHLLHISSVVLFVIKFDVFVLAYIMSNKALIFKGQKIMFWSFLIFPSITCKVEIDSFERHINRVDEVVLNNHLLHCEK